MFGKIMLIFIVVQSDLVISTILTNDPGNEEHRSSLIITTDDYMLVGHTIDKRKATDVFDCALCLVGDQCKSFSFNEATGDCYLHRRRAKDNELVQTDGFIYGEKNPCEAKPCQNGGECRIQDDRQDYKCKCRTGFDGKQCQNDIDECLSNSTGCDETGGACQNSQGSFKCVCKAAFKGDGFNCTEKIFIFSNLDANGREGPITTKEYDGTSLQGHVKLVNGIQHWTVPQTGNYVIEAWGASGGNGTNSTFPRKWRRGGLGARVKGVFFLNRGQSLKILVGQEGRTALDYSHNPGSGGGASFVTFPDNTPLVIAGGGGGGSSPADGWLDGEDGQATRNGSSSGGTGGNGGTLKKDYSDPVMNCGAGGGLKSAGQSNFFTFGGDSFTNGGKGGINHVSAKGNGGFGGGGAATSEPGGGGGYSGGGVVKTTSSLVAGGGGSYNGGELKENQAGVNKGHGKVIITISPN